MPSHRYPTPADATVIAPMNLALIRVEGPNPSQAKRLGGERRGTRVLAQYGVLRVLRDDGGNVATCCLTWSSTCTLGITIGQWEKRINRHVLA